MREEVLTSILSELNGTSADVEASAILSTDGLIISSLLPSNVDEDHVAAMSAAMLSLGIRTSEELVRGELEQVLVKGSQGYVILTSAGPDAVLSVLAKSNARLGLIFLDIKRASEAIKPLL
ncbi:roadblock/LC7 domain-containing protein [Ignatzschineria sp. RMDPL8A]|uniref:roadblock/LC7 domain-containing protein n=1 Tax=Ignatzschineria sp. RMDPL8A TaxID=2999236 RepID=UPI0016912881|nr:roadblock/LC7 domain-containing protein [Ignatzschineria sp. RMDPL8A]MDG9729969.1 roadblock/LC7 domain-containing protein [Ignatzschineria sp. RMDPL8A]NLD09282.1 hypothetical protein [Xanthomonadaceae bacterium]